MTHQPLVSCVCLVIQYPQQPSTQWTARSLNSNKRLRHKGPGSNIWPIYATELQMKIFETKDKVSEVSFNSRDKAASETGLAPPSQWDLVSDKQMMPHCRDRKKFKYHYFTDG
ncbi:hypothetical protein ZWY2020_044824 [Hordeum vulgare]|nr:hypothetical protein ZWY2020_044824 [Hordeum vulgare]